jgi:hypothetical protein
LILLSRVPGAAKLSDPGAGGWLDRMQLDSLTKRNFIFLVEFYYENFGERPFWSEHGGHDNKRAQDLARLRHELHPIARTPSLLPRTRRDTLARTRYDWHGHGRRDNN